jgi:hypothetical protein
MFYTDSRICSTYTKHMLSEISCDIDLGGGLMCGVTFATQPSVSYTLLKYISFNNLLI